MANLDHLGNPNLPGFIKQAQRVAVTTTNTQSAAFTANTNAIRVYTDAQCFIAANSNPTASTTVGTSGTNVSWFQPAALYEDIAVLPGDKIAAITSSGTANLYIKEF